ncbi:MAG: cytochrome-c peroxidase [Acidobacteria bacterium]|nr:cytochrome-c peroxidase [Acidobacteriota bacterium]MCW5969391.1 cytochrome-c peroxidase [Blastocatellales bacterium]
MYVKIILICAVALFAAGGWFEQSLLDRARQKLEPLPDDAPALSDNPSSAAKVELGKMLFFDPRLSSSWTISCNSCHNLGLGGVDRRETSLGHGWQKGSRNSPTVFNAVFHEMQFWDGRAKNLRQQVKGPVQSAIEMNNTPERVVQTLKSMPGYVERFTAAFPEDANPVSFDNVAMAIEVFEATLLTPDSRFDRFLKGDESALNEQEKRGLTLFLSKDCVSCHKGVNLGGASFHKFGAARKPGSDLRPPDDRGLMNITGAPLDEYVFRAPTLRNVELTAPYFHSGRVWDLRQAVATMASVQLDAKLRDRDIDDLTAFLRTLTGVLPRIEYPVLPMHTAETPRPDAK